MNAIDTVITDLEMLKNGSWIPDKDSCEASIRMLGRAKTEFDRMYSEEDLLEVLKFFIKDTRGDKPWVDADDEWFEQSKKKIR